MGENCSPEIFQLLMKELPSFFRRADVERLTNGLVKATTLANLAYEGKGPRTHRMGKHICYMKTEFLAWMVNYYEGINDGFASNRDRVSASKTAEDGTGTPS